MVAIRLKLKKAGKIRLQSVPITFFTFLVLTSFILLKDKPVFSYKVYGNIANYFEDEKDLLSFFNFKNDDFVAEVGALNGQNIAGLSILTDSITFYAEDINAKTLNKNNFDKALRKCKKYKDPATCKFELRIGTEKSTTLPDNSFDKIILIATLHEFSFMNEMLADIHEKLKPGGQLYVLESHCFNKAHKNYSAVEVISLAEKFNFILVKKDGKDLNGGSGVYRLILKK